jgi:hypothetical protein
VLVVEIVVGGSGRREERRDGYRGGGEEGVVVGRCAEGRMDHDGGIRLDTKVDVRKTCGAIKKREEKKKFNKDHEADR